MSGGAAGAWPALRDTDRDLAFALLFAPHESRDLLADRLNLALECEAAIRIASEPMLAAIRLQWWVEAIETGRHEQVPLMLRLLARIESSRIDAAALIDQIGLWQDRLASAPADAGACWADCFALLAPDRTAPARNIARSLYAGETPLSRDEIAGLKTPDTRWLWMLGRLAIHRQTGAPSEDPLLVWRMLRWRMLG